MTAEHKTRLHKIRPYVWMFVISIFLTIGLAAVQKNSVDNDQKAVISNAEIVRKNQVAACERGNQLRNANNKQVSALRVQKGVLSDFLLDAEQARRSAGTKTDIDAADKYRAGYVRLSKISYKEFDRVDCAAISRVIK